jgi:hypothetical protein
LPAVLGILSRNSSTCMSPRDVFSVAMGFGIVGRRYPRAAPMCQNDRSLTLTDNATGEPIKSHRQDSCVFSISYNYESGKFSLARGDVHPQLESAFILECPAARISCESARLSATSTSILLNRCTRKSRSDFGFGRMPKKIRLVARWTRSGRSEGPISSDESRY